MIKSVLKRCWVGLEQGLPDGPSLRLRYWRAMGKPLHLGNPRTFTEKLQWLKLNYRRRIMTELADKYAVRPYVAQRLGEGVLNELYGVWDRPEEIPFETLPNTFAMKVSSASHANIICMDKSKLNVEETKAKLRGWQATNYYTNTREWAYKDAK